MFAGLELLSFVCSTFAGTAVRPMLLTREALLWPLPSAVHLQMSLLCRGSWRASQNQTETGFRVD